MSRPQMTLIDYLIIAITPALIMVLIGSLVYFLIAVFYGGGYAGRLNYVMTLFVFAAVLIARIAIEEGRERSILYAIPLALATLFVAGRFVQFQGSLAPLSIFINAGLIVLVMWCADRLVWDCTVIDERKDVSGEGLLQTVGLDRPATRETGAADRAAANTHGRGPELDPDADATTGGEPPPEPKSWWERFIERRKRPHAHGVWVIYVSLAALPLFGIGQRFIPETDVEARRYTFRLMCYFVGSALGLLMTSSFLGIRRYLRHRRLEMPAEMTGVWLLTGTVMILALLFASALLPRPSAEYSVPGALSRAVSRDDLRASRYGFGSEGARDEQEQATQAAPSGDEDAARAAGPSENRNGSGPGPPSEDGGSAGSQGAGDSGGEQQSAQGSSGGSGNEGRRGDRSGGDSGSDQSQDQGQSQGQGQRDSGGAQGSGQERADQSGSGSGGQQPESGGNPTGRDNQQGNSGSTSRDSQQAASGERSSGEQSTGDQSADASSADAASRQSKQARQRDEREGQQGQRPRASNSASNGRPDDAGSSNQTNPSSPNGSGSPSSSFNPAQIGSTLVGGMSFLLKGLYYLFFLVLVGWLLWRYWPQVVRAVSDFLQAIRDFWANLFGGGDVESESEQEATIPVAPPRPFADYADPFLSGAADRYTAQQLLAYSFEALQAWGREHGCQRHAEQTPYEYAAYLSLRDRTVGREARRLAELYSFEAYSGGSLPREQVQKLRSLWGALRASTPADVPAMSGPVAESRV